MSQIYHSSSADQTQLSITVYNGHFGAVKEKRKMSLTPDVTTVYFMDVSSRIETDSLLIQGVKIHELNYDYDLVSKQKLLEKYLDRAVYLKQENSDPLECRLLSVQGGLVLENAHTKELYLDPKEELILPKLPDGLIVKPALVWRIPPQDSKQLEVSYLTEGFKWIANYVMELNGKECHINGWVNVTNETGASYENAKLKLIAGDVQRIQKDIVPLYQEEREFVVYSSIAEPSFEEKSFSDYHMYTLNQPVTLKNNQSKQIQFFQAAQIPCHVYYDCSTNRTKARTMVELHNTSEYKLGLPLPKGTVKVYQRDEADHELEFVGEDAMDHTPKNEKILLHIGEAFDLVCEHEMKNRQKKAGLTVETHHVILRNHKEQAASIKLTHFVHHRHFRVLKSSYPITNEQYKELLFEVEVPANDTIRLEFQIEIDESVSVRLE
jgi:hypothetical protein